MAQKKDIIYDKKGIFSMIEFSKTTLDNGLRVILNRDISTPLTSVNVLYNVGSADENPEHTGIAHLFEHLMFEGSVNIPDFDKTLQTAGGDNNAFTNSDITNYYLTLPAQNLETALWMESDRMLHLDFSQKKLTTQKDVVTEEFRQTYLNQPYGDIGALLRELLYKVHPYQWPTIGKSIDHIQKTSLEDIRSFFNRFYNPSNAIITVSGNFKTQVALENIKKWFGDIPAGRYNLRRLPGEPAQNAKRLNQVSRDVPISEIYIAYPTGKRTDESFFETDIITDILGSGKSSRLRENLVKKKKVFSESNAWISGSLDKGYLVIYGKLLQNTTMDDAEKYLLEQVELLKCTNIEEYELEKVKNKIESSNTFAELTTVNKAINLSFFELTGNADLINQQNKIYRQITAEQIKKCANKFLTEKNSCTLRYLSKNHKP